VANARDAMANGGDITIAVSREKAAGPGDLVSARAIGARD
jgi:hypothetical protein